MSRSGGVVAQGQVGGGQVDVLGGDEERLEGKREEEEEVV